MRIVHYLSSMDLNDGGVVRAVLDLCPALTQAGHEVVLLTCKDADVPETWKRAVPWDNSGVPACVTLPSPTLPGGMLGRTAMGRAREVVGGADVAHVHAMWIPSNEQITRACRDRGVPYIVSPHGMLDDWCMAQKAVKKRVYHALLAKRSLERAAAVHCTAEAELHQAGKWFGLGRGVVVPLPFDLADYRELPGPDLARTRLGLRADEPVVLYLSRLHLKKGVEILIRAMADLRKQGTRARLVIAGGGEESYVRTLHQLVAQLGMQESVLFAGFVKGREKVSLYQAAGVFALPSSQENFGYVVVEAMAAGTPVITTRGVALWPQLERDGVAMLVEPRVDVLAGAVSGMLRDPGASRELGRKGREWCLREMDPARITQGFIEMYAKASDARRSGTGSESVRVEGTAA